MSRTLTVSTDVFAAIWAQRKPGEETEEAILRRLLKCSPDTQTPESQSAASGGVLDSRNGVHFPEGFEVVRKYKHREYRARASNGAWLREDDGRLYPTLNQLNESIAAGNENIWNGNWKYRESDGTLRSIDALRR
ncbi:hypothetical protein J2W40_003129 [Sphingobium xenophagum]|uniref:Uncharacterized protein n=1 Tax=Sphingobium xenophagum TaxID=121428 RepID=A0ABU1X3X8_SPHXE|nr:hypothetical protein [Sphingobium xenophagum]MDR7156288.1 hypothetical protein [Sphingobium xenophagum]